jgi:tetratricopeptide (TPR) repeat protein
MFRTFLLSASVAALTLTSTAPVRADGAAGAYLAARQAAVRSDFAQAAKYFSEALARDTQNPELIESALLAYLSLGDIDRAEPLALGLEETGQKSQIAQMVLTAARTAAGDFDALIAADGDATGVGPWVSGLVKAWAQVGNGDMTAALAAFDRLAEEPGIRGFVNYHKAFALASVGDYEGAEAIFAADLPGTAAQTRRGVMARAEILSQLGQFERASTLLTESFGTGTDPELNELLVKLENDEAVPFSHVTDARDGIAEVFFTFASVLRSEAAGDYYILLYAQVARYLAPDHIDALLLTADLFERLEQYDLAIDVYKAVPASDPAYHAAEMGRAAAMRRSGKPEQAIEVLEQLTRSHGDIASVHSALGDALRSEEEFDAAITSYTRALDLTAEDNPVRWILYYSRGICEERSGEGEAAEADFRAALAINPDQPQVLNYLGYSLVEQGRNLDEALDMIERAVAASQDSGYIVDSLGWVLYRLGRYDEAVAQMERAVELIAVDPVVNDHLGDVYWAVGREREAEFQWKRALSFINADDTDTEADPERIRRKLEIGLDKVLEDEGAPPLKKVANDG